MTRTEAVTRIQEGLGFRTDRADSIVMRLKEAQRELEMGVSLPWFLREEDATLSLLANTNVVALPDNFARPLDDEPMRFTLAGETKVRYVERKELDKALTTFGSTDPGSPAVYALRADSLYFLPQSSTNLTITWSYLKHAVVLDSDVENEWLANAPEVLIGKAGLKMALDVRDADAVKIFTQMSTDASKALFREVVAREEAARRRFKGGR